MLKKITFWNKMQMSVQAVLSVTQLSLVFADSEHIYNVIVTGGQIIALIIPIWIQDANRDGVVDGFEKEVITTIKSDSPIKIETETITPKTEPKP